MAGKPAKLETTTAKGMATGRRHVYGPRAVGALIPAIARPTFRRHAPASAQLLADWEGIVGPALAAVATPRRLASGTLSLTCPGPVAMELQHLAPELMTRINTHLGTEAVRRLRFAQAPAPAPAAATPRATLSPSAAAAVEKAVSAVPDGPLRQALASLGGAVLARSARRAGRRRSGSTTDPSTS